MIYNSGWIGCFETSKAHRFKAIDNNDSPLEIVEYKKRNDHTDNDYLDSPFSGLRLREINSC